MRADAKGRVLVVDDDPEICRLLVKRLTREEFYCESCSSGKEALELLDWGKFDAVISDLPMAGISGVDLLQATRKNQPNSAFLMATVEDDIRVGIEAMEQGAADYLVKPLDLDVVVASLGRALELEAANKVLEAFCCSVPHHLRVPLRLQARSGLAIDKSWAGRLELPW